MSLKIFVSVCVALVMCFACNQEDVDTSYSFSAENVQAVACRNGGQTVEEQILLDSLKKDEYIGNFQFSGESRAENDKFAQEKFKESYKSVQKLDITLLFDLKVGEKAEVTFDYVLSREGKEMGREKVSIRQTKAQPLD